MAESAFGATISVAGTALAEVRGIGVPSLTGEVIEVTNHSSTNRYSEYIRGKRDAGEITVSMLYTSGSATDDACIASINSNTAQAIVLTAAAASGTEDISFNAFGTGYSVDDLNHDGEQTATLTLKPTGEVTQDAS